MYVRDRMALAELERIERKEPKSKRAKRLRIVILAMRGWTAPAIAMSTGLSRRACQEWVQRFNEAGLPGLEDRHGGGREAPLTPEQEEQMRERLDAGPTDKDSVCSLRGADVKAILAKEFGCSVRKIREFLYQSPNKNTADEDGFPRIETTE